MTSVPPEVAGSASLELRSERGVLRFAMDRPRLTVGKGDVDIAIADPTVSRLHASIEQVTGGWVLQDLGSRNGTFVNGDRVLGPRALRPNDEVRLGAATLTFRAGARDAGETQPLSQPPRLTVRERDMVVALCRPLLTGSVLAEPATTAEIAAELVVTESAVKKLLGRTYDKFRLVDDERRRSRLAADALRRGVVSLADL